MGKDSLPLVFGPGKLEYQHAQKWYDSLVANKDAYASCYIPSITRVKNLGSKYMHEYCQFIVEDRSTGERARVYAERMNEKDIDVVTIGRDEKAPRDWDELPLPLTSIAFEDKAKQPTLLDIAKLINSVSVVGGAYKFYDKNCFWFAFTTFDTVRLAFPGTMKNWLWVNPGGKGGGSLADAWGLGFPTMFKYFFKSTATEFGGKRKTDLVWLQPGENRETVTPDDYVQRLSGHLLEDRSVKAYSEWSKSLGQQVTKEDLVEITSKVVSNVKELYEKGEINWSLEFDSAVVDITQKIEDGPNASKYLEKYNVQPKTGYVDIDINDVDIGLLKAIDAVDGQDVGNPSRSVVFADSHKGEELGKALKMLVGAVLLDAKLGN